MAASQMQSSKWPHLAREPQVAEPGHNGCMSGAASHAVHLHVLVIHYFLSRVITPLNQYGGGQIALKSTLSESCAAAGERSPPPHLSVICLFPSLYVDWEGVRLKYSLCRGRLWSEAL